MKLNQSTNLTRRITMSVVALALVAAACSSGTSRDEPNTPTTAAPATGDPVPTREFVTFSGETATLASYTGKPVVLNFWASWCPSCVAEMSAAFRPVAADLGGDITFIGMNIQDDRALATELLQSTGVEWVSAEDPDGELYVDLGGIAMPFTVYISADGQVVEKHNGPLTERQLRDQIASSLG
jgi:thiol-disulfide isomerase/thioredoxin